MGDWVARVLEGAGVAVVAVAAWIAARGNVFARKVDAHASPYDALARRTSSLEQQVDQLRAEIADLRAERHDLIEDRDALREMVRALLAFIDSHIPATVPRPFRMPAWLSPKEG